MREVSMRRPSPAMAVALVALFVSLAGGSYAALKLPKNSVGAAQLKKAAVTGAKVHNGAITTPKLADGAVNGAKVQANSLTGTNINLATLGKVPTAAAADNAANAANAAHASAADTATTAGGLASIVYAVNTSAGPVTVPACGSNPCTPDHVGSTFAIASCPIGMTAIGGGGVTADPGVELAGSFPTTNGQFSAWEVDVDNYLTTQSAVAYFAVCAPIGSVSAVSQLGRAARRRHR
jgi:hypothetical protein